MKIRSQEEMGKRETERVRDSERETKREGKRKSGERRVQRE